MDLDLAVEAEFAGAGVIAAAAVGDRPTPYPANTTSRILFMVVVSGADLDCLEDPRPSGPQYTRDSLRNLLQLLGCKPRLAYKIMLAVFQTVDQAVINARQQRISRKTFQVHPHRNGRVYVSLIRRDFMSLVSTCAAQFSYNISPSSDELKVACSLHERRRCVVVMLCGTSGSGKSTLASILANRLGITTVISTDSIRHMLRSFQGKESAPLLWASTYQAGECVQGTKGSQLASAHERTLCGYKAQCELLADQLEVLIAGCEARQQSLICEGVHLNISLVLKLLSHHPDVLPFLVHIGTEEKHVERMAVRAKYMTLDPNQNRYVRYMGNIRVIQEYLVRKADKHSIPKVENTNVDRSVGIIHLTVMGCLRRMARGEAVLDYATNKTKLLAAEYTSVLENLKGEKARVAAAVGEGQATAPGSGAADVASSSKGVSSSSSVSALHLQQPHVASSSGASSSNVKPAVQQLLTANGMTHAPSGFPRLASECESGSSGGSRCSSMEAQRLQEQQQQQQQQGKVLQQAEGRHNKQPQQHAVQQELWAQQTEVQQECCPQVPQFDGMHGDSTSIAKVQNLAQHPQHQLKQESLQWVPTSAVHGASNSVLPAHLLPLRPLVRIVAAATGAGANGNVCSQVAQQDATAAEQNDVGAVASGGSAIDGNSALQCDLQLCSPEGPVMRWDKLIESSRLSPSDELLPQSPVTPVAAAGLAMRYPHSYSRLNPFAKTITDHPTYFDSLYLGSSSFPNPAQALHVQPGQGTGPQATVAVCSAAGHAGAVDGKGQDSGSDGGSGGDDEHNSAVDKVCSSPRQQVLLRKGTGDLGVESDVDVVSSGEELDGLGELNSSDNEAERFLQEYGSMNESTTCDEHDEDEHEFMGATGLRAWHAGITRALWPSFAHVYSSSSTTVNSSNSNSGSRVYSTSSLGRNGSTPTRPNDASNVGGSNSRASQDGAATAAVQSAAANTPLHDRLAVRRGLAVVHEDSDSGVLGVDPSSTGSGRMLLRRHSSSSNSSRRLRPGSNRWSAAAAERVDAAVGVQQQQPLQQQRHHQGQGSNTNQLQLQQEQQPNGCQPRPPAQKQQQGRLYAGVSAHPDGLSASGQQQQQS